MDLFKICEAIGTSGGAMLKIKNGEFVLLKRKRGFAVSMKDPEAIYMYKDAEQLQSVICGFIWDNIGLLSQNDKYVGVWVDNGVIYLDIKVIINGLNVALLRGRLEKQKSIYSFKEQGTLYLEDYKDIIDNIVIYEQTHEIHGYDVDDIDEIITPVKKPLNSCNAYGLYGRFNGQSAYVFYSYDTVIFIQIDGNLYFNQLVYSTTTSQHIHRFIKDYDLMRLDWYQLRGDTWQGLIYKLGVYTEYCPRDNYYDNGYKWLVNIDTLTQ